MKRLLSIIAIAGLIGAAALLQPDPQATALKTDAKDTRIAVPALVGTASATSATGSLSIERSSIANGAVDHGASVAAHYASPSVQSLPDAVIANAASAGASNDESQEPLPAAAAAKMSAEVQAIAQSGGTSPVEIIVRHDRNPELFDETVLEALGGEIVRGYDALSMRAIRLPAAALAELAIEDAVDWLSLDSAVTSFASVALETANAPSGASANHVYSGSSIGVAVIDSGIAQHSALGSNHLQYSFLNGRFPVPVVVNGAVSPMTADPRDDKFGHGTHVAGILAGNGADSDGLYEGPANNAPILALQALDRHGQGQMSDVLAALDWLLHYGDLYDIRVVNLSLGKAVSESNTTDPLVLAVDRLWDAGMVVVIAAGNDGHSGNMTINSPGNSRKAITVGSITDNGTGDDFSDDYVSTFSSLGPTVGDLVLKPDLVAPGNKIAAAIPNYAKLTGLLATRVKDCSTCSGKYLELSGTSMAAPLVSAAAAMMLEKNSSLTPSTVKARLMRSARKVSDEPTAVGAGVLDIDAALNETGVVGGDALSPLMIRDESLDTILVEDTGVLWGDSLYSAGFIYDGGFNWSDGYTGSAGDTVSATGYLWTDSGVWARGYLWSDESGVWARGYLWSDEVGARSMLEETDGGAALRDDP
ncbi:MAG: S8 family serine peptidase [Pseudomonadota bacterium]